MFLKQKIFYIGYAVPIEFKLDMPYLKSLNWMCRTYREGLWIPVEVEIMTLFFFQFLEMADIWNSIWLNKRL